MTSEEEIKLRNFEALVRRLMQAYLHLRTKNAQLTEALDHVQKELTKEQEKTAEVEKKYEELKIARILEVSGGDIKMSRERLNKILREVDKCIALLNV